MDSIAAVAALRSLDAWAAVRAGGAEGEEGASPPAEALSELRRTLPGTGAPEEIWTELQAGSLTALRLSDVLCKCLRSKDDAVAAAAAGAAASLLQADECPVRLVEKGDAEPGAQRALPPRTALRCFAAQMNGIF